MDIEKLDLILLDLVDRYALDPTCKPARWEPRSFSTSVERGDFDTNMQQIGRRAWRGYPVSAATRSQFRNLHTPAGVTLLTQQDETGFLGPARSIRTAIPGSETPTLTPTSTTSPAWICVSGSSFEPRRYVKNEDPDQERTSKRAGTAYDAIAHELALLPGSLVEVILDPNEDPEPLLGALAKAFPNIAVTALASVDEKGHAETWASVRQMIREHPTDDETDLLVLVIDLSTVVGVVDTVVSSAPETGETSQGPFVPSGWKWELTPSIVRAMAAWLSPVLEQLRTSCETTGRTVVVVTVDARPDKGKGPLARAHYFRDSRVRSWIGDAGRFYCHQRYLVERTVETKFKGGYTKVVEDGDDTIIQEHHEYVEQTFKPKVTVIKDEAEGLVGRVLSP